MIDALTAAIQAEQVVQFYYQRSGDHRLCPASTKRTFSPWEVDMSAGSVLGWDHDREGIRRFKFESIVGDVVSYPNEEYARPA